MTKGTLTQLYFDGLDRFLAREQPAFRAKRDGAYRPVTHRAAAERVRAISHGLRELGIAPGERVAILSETRLEWALVDYACLCAHATDVPIYPTLLVKQVEYILRDSGAVAVFCSTPEQVAKVAEVRRGLPIRHVIVFDGPASDGVMTLADLEQRGASVDGKYPDFRSRALEVSPDSLATLIYTSGTTGDPKGVMLTHDNLYSNVQACVHILPINDSDECLAMLPLSHVYERMVDYTMWAAGVVISYAESFDKVAQNLRETRPTIVLSVPRLYEKVYAKVLEGASKSPLKHAIFSWSKRAGDRWATFLLSGVKIPPGIALAHAVADRLVFKKIRAATGGRIKTFISGSAPLSADVGLFFFAAGLPILEGYGLTETSPVLTLNPPQKPKLGTVGAPIPGVTLKIAADGEILARGPNIMQGYYNLPKETAEALDADGWFHTGDIGELDADGYLKITDRKKDMIKTAGGKWVAPQPIENAVKANKYVANVVLLGDKRKFPLLLVVPNFDQLEAWAKYRRIAFKSRIELINLPDVKAKMERECIGMLRDLPKYEMPKKVALLEHDFTIESGELTPTLKVKRRVVEQHYETQIGAAYAEADPLAAAVEG